MRFRLTPISMTLDDLELNISYIISYMSELTFVYCIFS